MECIGTIASTRARRDGTTWTARDDIDGEVIGGHADTWLVCNYIFQDTNGSTWVFFGRVNDAHDMTILD
jgi:hypothetical protein